MADNASQTFTAVTGVAKRAFFGALGLTGATLVIGLIAAVATQGPQCAGVNLTLHYQPKNLVFLVVPAAAGMVMCRAIGWCEGSRRDQLQGFLKDYDWSVFEMASIQISYASFIIYGVLAGSVGVSALFAGKALIHCIEILTNCQLLADPH